MESVIRPHRTADRIEFKRTACIADAEVLFRNLRLHVVKLRLPPPLRRRIAAFTTNPSSPLAGLADALVIIPAAQKTDHGSSVSRQYSGSLFEQVLFLATEALFQSLWDNTDVPAEELWLRHANLE